MKMNAYEMHELFRQEADEIETDDINWTEIDRLLSLSIDDILQDRFDNIFVKKRYSIQSALRVMQELSSITVENNTFVVSGNNVPTPTDYYFPLALQVTINSKKYYCDFVSIDFLKGNENNPFRKAEEEEPKALIIKDSISSEPIIKVYPGDGNTLTGTSGATSLFYLKKPTYPVTDTDTTYSNLSTLTVGWKMYVWDGSVIYNSVTYTVGQTFTVITGITVFTGTGLCIKIVDTDVPWQLHDEIVRKAVSLFKSRMSDFQQAKEIKDKELDS